MAGRRDFLNRDAVDTKSVDDGIKNKWNWKWLDEKVGDVFVAKYIRKLTIPGKAYCTLCECDVKYGSLGRVAVTDHFRTEKHVDKESKQQKLMKTNYKLPSMFMNSKATTSSNDPTYGLHPRFQPDVDATKIPGPPKPAVSLPDRVSNSEAMILAFVAEKTLSFSVVPDLIKLTKNLATDKKALSALSMDRTTASYKTRFGLAKTARDDLVAELKQTPFSLNIEESTSKNMQRVLAILVSHFSETENRVVVNHLKSITVLHVNSSSLYEELVDLLREMDLPWTNVMSVLMDSCNVMRGSKSGVETRLRANCAPHLLDIDGDTCHHAHNAAKVFCKPFLNWLEHLFMDLYNDLKWSVDLRDYFQSICLIVGVKYTMPERFISHRWLSSYDVAVDTMRLLDAYSVFYFGFLSKADKVLYTVNAVEIYKRKDVSEEGRSQIRKIHQTLQAKNMTQDGKNRKMRIVQKLFVQRKLTKMQLNFYISVLPLLKKYILTFEMKTPMIHKLNDCQTELVRDFLACCLNPEDLSRATTSRMLKEINIATSLLPARRMFVGRLVDAMIATSRRDDKLVKDFHEQLKEAYKTTSVYLLKKMPLDNDLLKRVSAIDPMCRGSNIALRYMLKLPKLVVNVLGEEELDSFEMDVRRYHSATDLPSYDPESSIDIWWASISNKFQILSRMVKALLSCFHGPMVESSFSSMGDIIDEKSGRMKIDTFSDIQTIKYMLKSSGKSAVDSFKRSDILYSPVNQRLTHNLQQSYRLRKASQDEAAKLENEKRQRLAAQATSIVSKRKAKEASVVAAKKARLAHQVLLKKRTPTAKKSTN